MAPMTPSKFDTLVASKKFQCVLVVIDPTLAQHILDRNPENRKVNKPSVNMYAKLMSEGRFDGKNGDTVKVAINGELNDGQHRLHAVIESGKSIETLIAFNMSRESRHTIDQQRARTPAEILAMNGHSESTKLAPLIEYAEQFKRSGHRYIRGPAVKLSTTEKLDAANKDPRYSQAIQWANHKSRKKFAPEHGSITFLALMWYIIEEQPRGDEFMEALATGSTTNQAVLYVRDQLNKVLSASGDIRPKVWVVLRAFSDFVNEVDPYAFPRKSKEGNRNGYHIHILNQLPALPQAA